MANGPWQILITLLVLSVVASVLRRRSRGGGRVGSALVAKAIHIDESQDCQVNIVARKSGLISFILALFGIDSTFTLQVYADRVESQEGSLSGRIKTTIPLVALDTFTGGYTRPFYLLVLAVVFVVSGFFLGFTKNLPGIVVFLFIVFAGVCVLFYFLKKCLLLCFTTNGANGISLVLKRSVIEGVNVDEALADRIGELVKQDYIVQARK